MSTSGEPCSDVVLMSTEEDLDTDVVQLESDVIESINRDTPSPSMKSGSFGSKSSSLLRLNQAQDSLADQAMMKAASAEFRSQGGHSDQDDTDSELSDSENFLCKGSFLLTPSHELNMEKASAICEKMNFKGPFSLTKTATGILFKFAEPEDYQATYKKGFHKVTGARFYKKIPIPCRPQKTFVVFVLEVPEEVPEEDIRHSLYKFQSIVEVIRIPNQGVMPSGSGASITSVSSLQASGNRAIEKASSGASTSGNTSGSETGPTTSGPPPPIVRVTLASLEECNILLQNGLDFYGATFFPTEPAISTGLVRAGGKKSGIANSRSYSNIGDYLYGQRALHSRLLDVVGSTGQRVRDLLPVFDSAGFAKIPPPSTKTVKPK